MSAGLHRASPQMIGPWTCRAIACTASKSPGEAIGKPGLDHVHAEVGEGPGHLELLAQVHAAAGALLAVAQRGVEDDHAVRVGSVQASLARSSPGNGSGPGTAFSSGATGTSWFGSTDARREPAPAWPKQSKVLKKNHCPGHPLVPFDEISVLADVP